MRIRSLIVDLDDAEQFQLVVGGKDRLLVERLELRGMTRGWVRLHGHVVPRQGEVYRETKLRLVRDLPPAAEALVRKLIVVGGNLWNLEAEPDAQR